MAKVNGFMPACEACGWQSPIAMPTRALALEAAHDHEYRKGCPAKGEISPSVLMEQQRREVQQRVRMQKRRAARQAALKRGDRVFRMPGT